MLRETEAAAQQAADHENLIWRHRQVEQAAPDLLDACRAAVAYDDAINACGNDPEKMATFCTAQGDDLDNLYVDFIDKARAALSKAEPTS